MRAAVLDAPLDRELLQPSGDAPGQAEGGEDESHANGTALGRR
jgi:hypothetical protein